MNFKFRRHVSSSPRLGLAPKVRDYDLPFHDDRANRFLVMLIGLMTYMAILAAAAGLVLTGMGTRWSSDLARHMTIEIPSVDAKGKTYDDATQTNRVTQVLTLVGRHVSEDSITVKSPADVGKLVEPWLGASEKILGQVPLPTLISIESITAPDFIEDLRDSLVAVAPDIRVETHQGWLDDVLRLTRTLSFAAYLIGFITAITTVSAVSGAVRARMAAYHEQLEILHLMGAADDYISRQFKRHALQLALSGAGTGFILSMVTLVIIDQLAGSVQLAMVPSLILNQTYFWILLVIPLLTCALTVTTTQFTVSQSLKEMP